MPDWHAQHKKQLSAAGDIEKNIMEQKGVRVQHMEKI